MVWVGLGKERKRVAEEEDRKIGGEDGLGEGDGDDDILNGAPSQVGLGPNHDVDPPCLHPPYTDTITLTNTITDAVTRPASTPRIRIPSS